MSIRSAIASGAFTLLLVANTAHATSSAELYRTDSYKFGRFEARIRYAGGNGAVSSFFLWKNGSEVSGTFWNELDFEKLGAACGVQTNLLYGSPLTHREQQHTLGDLCGAYHDYRFEWTPEYIAFAVDGQEIRRATGADAQAFADHAGDGMTFHFNVWPGNATFGGALDPATLPVHQFVSWAQYSAYQNGAFALTWREDFDGDTLPSGWALGDWKSPLNLSTHVPANVTFKQGVAVLSLTADNVGGYQGEVPPDVAAGGSGDAAAGGSGAAQAGSPSSPGGGTTGGHGGELAAGSAGAPSGAGGASSGSPSGNTPGAGQDGTAALGTGASGGGGGSASCSFGTEGTTGRGAAFGSALAIGIAFMRRRRRGGLMSPPYGARERLGQR